LFWVSQPLFLLFLLMFIRKKENKSGSVSIQIIDKSSGKYKVVKTIGSSQTEGELASLLHQAKKE